MFKVWLVFLATIGIHLDVFASASHYSTQNANGVSCNPPAAQAAHVSYLGLSPYQSSMQAALQRSSTDQQYTDSPLAFASAHRIMAAAAPIAHNPAAPLPLAGVQQYALVPAHQPKAAVMTRHVSHQKPSEKFVRLADFVPALGLVRHFDDRSAVRAIDFFDKKIQHEPLLMLTGPVNNSTDLVQLNNALSPASHVTDAVITNMLISVLDQNQQASNLMLHSDALDQNRITPSLLLLAKSGFNNYKAVDALIERRVRVNYESAMGETPLHLACEQGHEQIVLRLLEEAYSDINKRTYKTMMEQVSQNQSRSIIARETPLMIAVKNQHRSCVILMILAGSKLDVLSHRELTAQGIADRVYDYELQKVPKGNTEKAQGIIELFKNHDYIERYLTGDEITLLKDYFLTRYPGLATIPFEEPIKGQVQVIVCRYLGFARWDNVALSRAFGATADWKYYKMSTPDAQSDTVVSAAPSPSMGPNVNENSDASPSFVASDVSGAGQPTDLPVFVQYENGDALVLNTIAQEAQKVRTQIAQTTPEKFEFLRAAFAISQKMPSAFKESERISSKSSALLAAFHSFLMASDEYLHAVEIENKARQEAKTSTQIPK